MGYCSMLFSLQTAILMAREYIKDCEALGIKIDYAFISDLEFTLCPRHTVELVLVSNQFTDDILENFRIQRPVKDKGHHWIGAYGYSLSLFQANDEYLQRVKNQGLRVL